MRLRQALALLLTAVFALLPVSTALAEGDEWPYGGDPWATTPGPELYQEGNGWTYKNGVFTLLTNDGWHDVMDVHLPSEDHQENMGYFIGYPYPELLHTVVIGKDVTEPIYFTDSMVMHPDTVCVEEGNTSFAIINGWVVYTPTHTLICAEHFGQVQETAVVIDNLPKDLRCIGACAFFGYRKLEQIVLPEGITEIGYHAFDLCFSLSRIHLPESLCTLEAGAFSSSGLTECNWPTNLEALASYAFARTQFRYLDLSDTQIRRLSAHCFGNCQNLTWITFPETLERIDSSAFGQCNSLRTLVIAANSVVIEDEAFGYCPSLQNLVFLKGPPTILGKNLLCEQDVEYWEKHLALPIPTPVFYYTETYQEHWAPNGETQWYGYDIQPITQAGIDALLTVEPAEAAAATDAPAVSPEPVETPAPEPTETATPTPTAKPVVEPTSIPQTEETGHGTGAWVMVLLAAVGALAVAVTILGIRLYGKGRK